MPLAFNPSSPISGSSIIPWKIQTGDYTAEAGERILIDTSAASWVLSLPKDVEPGDEIDLFGIAGLESNSLTINLGDAKFQNQILASLKLVKNDYIKLVYAGATIGWMASNAFNLAIELPRPVETFKNNSLFDDAPAPNYDGNDGIKYNIGTQFRVLVAGEIIGLKMWKNAPDTSTFCTVNLWDVATQQIIHESQITYSASYVGWVTKTLAAPILVAANKEYIISTQSFDYVAHSQGMTPSGNHIRDKLIAIKSVFDSFPLYPTKNFSGTSNYYRDVIFRYRV